MANAEQWLTLLLRVTGGVMCLAAVPVFMPTNWMAACHAWLGLGAYPQQPVVEYLARATSGFYALTGALLALAARDVRRFGPVITVVAVGMLVMGVAVAGRMVLGEASFRLFAVADAVSACGCFAAVLWLQRLVRRRGGGAA